MDAKREPLIEFKGVSKTFGNRNILNRIDLSVYEGEVTTLIGLSGTGKSVTLKHIIGMLKPDEGQILYRGKPIDQMSKKEWNDYIGQISYMFQNNALFDSMTVFENVAMPLKYTTKLKKKEIEVKAMARIEQTELTEVADKYPSEISGGMQKRAALARALVSDPNIVLFDEPTTGQDPIRKNAILSMVAEYQKRFGFTALLISHEIPDVYFISNRILALYDRKIVFQGDPEDFEALDHPFRQELISSLESLGQELTGLYSKRHFKVRYQSDLSQRHPDASYAAAVFTIDDLDFRCVLSIACFKAKGVRRAMNSASFSSTQRWGLRAWPTWPPTIRSFSPAKRTWARPLRFGVLTTALFLHYRFLGPLACGMDWGVWGILFSIRSGGCRWTSGLRWEYVPERPSMTPRCELESTRRLRKPRLILT